MTGYSSILRQQLAPYQELHENAKSAKRQFEFVVLADLVIFGQFTYESPYWRSSIGVIVLCGLFVYWHIDALNLVSMAYREKFLQVESDGAGPTVIGSIEGDPIELLDDLIHRSNSLAYLLFFLPVLYLATVSYFQASPVAITVLRPLGTVGTAHLYIGIFAVLSTSLAYYFYRPTTRLSLTIDPEPNHIGDRIILFLSQNEERIDRYSILAVELLREIIFSLFGLFFLLIGIAMLANGNIGGLAVIFIGLLLFWPARWLLSYAFGIDLDLIDVIGGMAGALIVITAFSALLDIIVLRTPVESLLRVVIVIVSASLGIVVSKRLRATLRSERS